MCTYKVLAHNENGYIVLCQKCNHFQLAFGTTVVCLCETYFHEFRQQATEQLQFYKDDGFAENKIIHLSVFCAHVQMIVSLAELKKLVELIEEAVMMREVDGMIIAAETGTPEIKTKKYG